MPMADGRAVLFGVDQPDGREEDHITTKLNLVVVLKQSTSVSIEEKLLRNQALPFSAFFFWKLGFHERFYSFGCPPPIWHAGQGPHGLAGTFRIEVTTSG